MARDTGLRWGPGCRLPKETEADLPTLNQARSGATFEKGGKGQVLHSDSHGLGCLTAISECLGQSPAQFPIPASNHCAL